jgi:Asp-tRNA(Asn)/Glu-tRNA(Gln) amidotransferase A subunit family amidase
MSEDGLIAKTAVELVGLLRMGEVSSRELLDALERRIAAVDGAVGALLMEQLLGLGPITPIEPNVTH